MKELIGVVVSTKSAKTVVIRVDSYSMHPLYEKRVLSSKKFHAHDEEERYSEGDEVTIKASRPRSRLKRWEVVYS